MSTPPPAQTSVAAPFSDSSQSSQPTSLSRQAVIWLVVLSCIIVTASIVIVCLLCRCRRRKRNGRVTRGYSVTDGRNEFQHWNKSAPPLPPLPPYPGYGFDASKKSDASHVAPLAKAAVRPAGSAMMEPMFVEEAGDGSGYQRNSKKSSRYYGGMSARFSRFSHIGRAL